MAEFRWILLGLGLLLIAGIWWRGGRRSSQAPGNAELRETTAKEAPRLETGAPDVESAVETHEWEISPFEPLSIKTAGFDDVPILDEPIVVEIGTSREPEYLDNADTIPNDDSGPVMPPVLTAVVPPPEEPAAIAPVPAAQAPVVLAPAVIAPAEAPVNPGRSSIAADTASSDNSDRFAMRAPRKANSSEKQKIVSVRVCAPAAARWSGSTLLSALETHGLAYGRYQVFHRRHVDGRSLFCVASLVEPGTFDMSRMPEQEFKGVTLFAVLPGPVDPLLTLDEMLSAARGLAGELPGLVQDAKGAALSMQAISALRDDVAHFQSTLPVP